MKLLILLAKVRLTQAECADANKLLREITDWKAFTDITGMNFGMPLMRRHLAVLDQDLIPEQIRQVIHAEANATVARNMQIIGVQKRFLNDCLAPIGVKGIFFKGITLAAQYYSDIGLRPCRDVDVLIAKGSMLAVLQRALAHDYKVIAPNMPSRPLTHPRDIQAVLKFGGSATLISPEGMLIDLQDSLDKSSCIFEDVDVLSDHDVIHIAGTPFPTMRTAFLFNYLCHHHARHTWSHLHWLSDLDAIVSSDAFDRAEALDLAQQLGQQGTIEASLELHMLMSSQTDWGDDAHMQRGKAFLRLCMANLPGGIDLEKKVSFRLMGGEFMFPWQARADIIANARRRWWRIIMRPTLMQYVKHPLPEKLQWLYYIPRFFYLVGQVMQRRKGSDFKNMKR